MKKFILATAAVVAMFSGALFAQTAFKTSDECLAAGASKKGVSYEPKKQATETDRKGWAKSSVGKEFDGAYPQGFCAKDGDTVHTATDTPWVFYGPEFEVAVKDGDVVMWKCANRFPKQRLAIAGRKNTVATAPEKAPVADCVDDCGNLTRTRTITDIIQQKTICRDRNGREFAPDSNGECVFPTTTATLLLKAETPTEAKCTSNCVTKEIAREIGSDTSLKFCALRTSDGHIVGVFNHNGFVQVVKMGESNVNPDLTANFANNPLSFTFDSQSVAQYDNGDCKKTQLAVMNGGWAETIKQLGLPNHCKPVGREWRAADNKVTAKRS